MPSIGTLGGTLPWGPKSLKVKCQAFPSDSSTGLKQPAPVSPPVTIMRLEPRMQLHVAGRSKNFLVNTGATPTLSCPPTLEPSPPKPVPFWVLQKKYLQKDSPKHFFVAGKDRYFPTSFWWSLSVLLPYWEEINSLNWRPPL